MKCAKVDGKVRKVSNEEASKLVRLEGATYCPKPAWKTQRKES